MTDAEVRVELEEAVSPAEYSGDSAFCSGRIVVVGVKLDERSNELLTWSLMKIAQSGDTVIALHVIEPATEAGKSTSLSLIKSFNSVLAPYEGFCHLKQVNLKLKVCRGSSVQRIIVKEAKSYAAAKVVVGASHSRMWSRISVAKYSARKLSKSCSVFAVDKGRVSYSRESSDVSIKYLKADHSANERLSRKKDIVKKISIDGMALSCNHDYQLSDGLSWNGGNESSLVLVQFQKPETCATLGPTSLKSTQTPSHGIDRNSSEKASSKRGMTSANKGRRLPSLFSFAAIYPDSKQITPKSKNHDEGMCGRDVLCPFPRKCSFVALPKEIEAVYEKYTPICKLFSYEELLTATCEFCSERLVGKGGSSEVYRGTLQDGKEVAVKILKETEDVSKEFVSELDILLSLHHKNIIPLLGFCFEGKHFLLVYDYMQRGSLEENIHGCDFNKNSFGWIERYKVALFLAEALNYLHNENDPPVIHKDVKSSNVLLNEDFEPQLADFGLAMRASRSLQQVSCRDIAGTFGYLAPEYMMDGEVDEKIDVYAYGVVLLELLSGRRPIDSEHMKDQKNLVMWAKQILKRGDYAKLIDPRLEGGYEHVQNMVLAATLCIRCSPRSRPPIDQVLKILQGNSDFVEELDVSEEVDASADMRCHLNLAMLGLEDDSFSSSSTEQEIVPSDYLCGR